MPKVDLTGKRFTKKRIKFLTEAFEILENIHEEVALNLVISKLRNKKGSV